MHLNLLTGLIRTLVIIYEHAPDSPMNTEARCPEKANVTGCLVPKYRMSLPQRVVALWSMRQRHLQVVVRVGRARALVESPTLVHVLSPEHNPKYLR